MRKRVCRENFLKRQTQTELEGTGERKGKRKKKVNQKPKSLLCTPDEVKVKLHENTIMVTNRLQRKQLKTPTPEPSTSPLKVSKLFWNSLTPKSRRKAKLKQKETDTLAGLSHQFQEELGVNLSNPISSSYEKDSIKTKVESFFNRDDISRLCLDKRKVVKNPAKIEEQQ